MAGQRAFVEPRSDWLEYYLALLPQASPLGPGDRISRCYQPGAHDHFCSAQAARERFFWWQDGVMRLDAQQCYWLYWPMFLVV